MSAGGLGARRTVTSTRQLVRALRVVENAAITGGVPAAKARDATYSVARAMAAQLSADRTLTIRPTAIYRIIAAGAAAGSRASISRALLEAHRAGKLSSRGDP